MTSPYDYITHYGWQIFPCHSIQRGQCTCPKGINCQSPGKHPLTQNGFKDATASQETIRAWLARWPWCNWALATGRANGVVVIDIDPRNGGFDSIEEYEQNRQDGPLPETLRSSTGGGGRHLFYAYPPDATIKGDNRGRWLKGVDVKSDGGYVVLPEGEHFSGGRYAWVNWGERPVLMPPDVVSDLSRQSAANSTRGDLPDTSEILKGVPEGRRDDELFRLACRLRRQLGDGARDIVEMAILKAARGCSPPFPDEEALRKVEQAWRQDHDDSFVDWATGAPSGQLDADKGITTRHPLTDLGNGKRYIEEYGRDVTYVSGWGWMVWTDVGWQRDDMGWTAALTHNLSELVIDEARQLEAEGADMKTLGRYAEWARRCQAVGTMNNALSVAKDEPEIRRSVVAFDAEDHLLSCRNGIVDLRDGSIRLPDRNDLVTKNTGVIYDPEFQLPEWEQFLWDSCNGDEELMEYMRRACGYSLTGRHEDECLFMIWGPPASGKSTLLDAMHAALGSYATATSPDTFMWTKGGQQPQVELARMAGMRLVSMSETKQGQAFNENLIKAVTGDSRITGKFLYENPFEFEPKFKLWIGTNHTPMARDDGLWRRIKLIKFPNAVPPEKRSKKLKIMLRDPDVGGKAVLAWAVKGAMEWYRDGLKQPLPVTAAVFEYHQEQDQMQQFVDECVRQSDGTNTALNAAYMAYRIWCSNVGVIRMPSRQQFATMMRDKGFKTILDEGNREMYIGIVVSTPFLGSNML